jgi:hypothetical protein
MGSLADNARCSFGSIQAAADILQHSQVDIPCHNPRGDLHFSPLQSHPPSLRRSPSDSPVGAGPSNQPSSEPSRPLPSQPSVSPPDSHPDRPPHSSVESIQSAQLSAKSSTQRADAALFPSIETAFYNQTAFLAVNRAENLPRSLLDSPSHQPSRHPSSQPNGMSTSQSLVRYFDMVSVWNVINLQRDLGTIGGMQVVVLFFVR